MITTNTLVRTSEPERYLAANFGIEDPLVLQLGGSCPSDMRAASAMARKTGFKEININAGCPSEKVSGMMQWWCGLLDTSTYLSVSLSVYLRLVIFEVAISSTPLHFYGSDHSERLFSTTLHSVISPVYLIAIYSSLSPLFSHTVSLSLTVPRNHHTVSLGAGCFGAALMLQPELLSQLGEWCLELDRRERLADSKVVLKMGHMWCWHECHRIED